MGNSAYRVCALATAVGDAVNRALERAVGVGGSGPAALLALSQEPGMTVERLAVTVGVTGSGAVRLLDRLEAEGLVERRRGADPRARYAYLTAAGRRMARKAFEARNRELDRTLAGLSPADRQTFSRLTDTLLATAVDNPASAERACRFCDLDDCPDGTCPLEDVHGRA